MTQEGQRITMYQGETKRFLVNFYDRSSGSSEPLILTDVALRWVISDMTNTIVREKDNGDNGGINVIDDGTSGEYSTVQLVLTPVETWALTPFRRSSMR